jgi:(S)-2-hydroxyglutarate dehydrogenase
VPFERCGKVIVATSAEEIPGLDALEWRGRQNGVPGLRRLGRRQLREIEPHAEGVAALHSPATGIVDFSEVARALADDLTSSGTPVVTSWGVDTVEAGGGRIALRGPSEVRARFAVFCAGVGSDKLAVKAGASPDPRIVPFRGAYLYLKPEKRDLVRSLIYPVPDPSLPFLGVHLTRHIDGNVSLGPTALLAPRGVGDLLWPGTVRMALQWWRTGLTEIGHRLSKRALARAAADYVPVLTPADFDGGFAGKRAQALARDGKLVDDFAFSVTDRALHVRNAPSPGATSSLAIGRHVADRAEEAFGLTR